MPVELREPKSNLFEREVKKFPWVAYCLEPNCYFAVSAKDQEQGEESLRIHKCPYVGSPDRIPSKPLLSAMWRELDACMDGIMLTKAKLNTDPEDESTAQLLTKLEHWKSRAGGIATCLFICLGGEPGYYTEQADITREAVRRYEMRVGDRAWEPTQGDAYDALRDGPTERWETVVWQIRQRGNEANNTITPPPNKGLVTAQPRKRRASGQGLPVGTAPRKLADDVVTGIKNALAADMDPQMIASIFQVNVSDVEALRGE